MSRARTNNSNNNYCSYNAPGYGYGLGSCSYNYSSSYNSGGSSNIFSSSGYGGGNGNNYSGFSYGSAPMNWKVCLLAVVLPIVITVGIFVVAGALLGGFLGAEHAAVAAQNSRARGDPSILTLSPGVTREVSFGNAFFCDQVTLEVNGSRGIGASVYLITDTPPLTHRNSFTRRIRISRFSIISNLYVWNYLLYSGTDVTTSLYMSRPPMTGTFSISRRGSRDRPIASSSVRCTINYNRQFSFQVQNENEYYFVYQGGRFGVSGTPCTYPVSLRLNIPFQLQLNISASWFVHSTAGLMLQDAPRCSATSGRQCSLSVPADSNYRALIVTDLPTNNPDLSENINIRLQCSSNRGWAYAVVVLLPLLLVVGVIITTIILLVVWWRKRDSLRATCCSRHNTQTTTTEAAPTSAVELQEMESQEPQQPAADQKGNKTTSDSQKDGQQHLTAAPPPSYKDSLDYPTQKTDLPPPYNKK